MKKIKNNLSWATLLLAVNFISTAVVQGEILNESATQLPMPTSLTASVVTVDSVTLIWDNSTDPTITGYRVYRDDTYLEATHNTVYSDSGLSPGALYTYKITSIDTAQNESDAAAVVVNTLEYSATPLSAENIVESTGYCGDGIVNNGESCDVTSGIGDRQSCSANCEIVSDTHDLALTPAPSVRPDLQPHPRLYITETSLTALRNKLAHPDYAQDVNLVRSSNNPTDQAFSFLVWGDLEAGNTAKAALLSGDIPLWGGMEGRVKILQTSLMYDWLYTLMTPLERTQAISVVKSTFSQTPRSEGMQYYWNDQWARGPAFETIAALALADDDDWANAFIDKAYTSPLEVFSPYGGGAIDVLNTLALESGGGHQAGISQLAGTGYESMFLVGAAPFLGAWQSATNEELLSKTTFFEKLPYYISYAYLHNDNIGEQAKQTLEHITAMGSEESASLAKWLLERYGRARYARVMRLILGDLPRVTAMSPEQLGLPKAAYLPGADLVVSKTGWADNDTSLFMFARHWDTSRYEPDSGVLSIYKGNKPLLVRGIKGKKAYDFHANSGMWIWDENNEKSTLGQGDTYWGRMNTPSRRATSAVPVFDPDTTTHRPKTLTNFTVENSLVTATTRYEKLLHYKDVELAERSFVHDLDNSSVRITDHIRVSPDARVAWALRLAEEPLIEGNQIITPDMVITLMSSPVNLYWSGGEGRELIGPTGNWHGDRKAGYVEGYSADPVRRDRYGLGYVFAEPINRSNEYFFEATVEITAEPVIPTTPLIERQPVSQEIVEGNSASFSVYATGGGLSYQWKKGGVDIPGAVFNSYRIATVTGPDAGVYSVVVTNSSGTAVSNDATLTVVAAPPPENHPPVLDFISDITVNEGDTVIINATATDPDQDTLTFSYSGWMNDSRKVTSQGDAGVHTVTVTVSDGILSDTQEVMVTVNSVDQSSLVISNIQVTDITDTSVTVSWITNEAADSEVQYGDGAVLSNLVADRTLSQSHSLILIGLIPGTTYSYLITSRDSAGNTDSSSVLYFSTATGSVPLTIGPVQVDIENPTSLQLSFSRPVDRGTAEDIGNYTIDGAVIKGATLSAGNRIVTLTTTPIVNRNYRLIVNNVIDQAQDIGSMVNNAEIDFTLPALVDFEVSDASSTYGLAGWDTVFRDTYTVYRDIGPQGTTQRAGPNGGYDYQRIASTTGARQFVKGDKIVVTWYNNSDSSITFTPRISFDDPDRPVSGEIGTWTQMSAVSVPPFSSAESSYTLPDDGHYSFVNINANHKISTIETLICDKIHLLVIERVDPVSIASVSTEIETPTTVKVRYSRPVDRITAEDTANYRINGVAIHSATLSSDNLEVLLETTPIRNTGYQLIVNNVVDITQNPWSTINNVSTAFTLPALVDFGSSVTNTLFGLSGWNEISLDRYTVFRDIGPQGTTQRAGPNGGYDYQRIASSIGQRQFSAGDKIVVSWYNNSAMPITFTPKISLDDPDRAVSGETGTWEPMSEVAVPPFSSTESEYTIPADGLYSFININANHSITTIETLVCDKIYLLVATSSTEPLDNHPPLLEHIPDITVNIGEAVELNVVASDPDGDAITITYAGWMTSDSYITTSDDVGIHSVTVTVSDGELSVTQDLSVTVAGNVPLSINSVSVDIERPTEVNVLFSKPLDRASAEDTNNYFIDGSAIYGATLSTDSKSVTLNTSPIVNQNYTLTVNNVIDSSHNLSSIINNEQIVFSLPPLVDFGYSAESSTFGLQGWDTISLDTYTVFRDIGPHGTTQRAGPNGAFDYQRVTSSVGARQFSVGDRVVVTWYNNSDTAITFMPKISFDDPDRVDSGEVGEWGSMSEVTVPPFASATSEYMLTLNGNYTFININANHSIHTLETLVCDKIELLVNRGSF
ncbi:MAG: fibronectin type III domain-containing protein [Candidatus Thiodiazotropha sp. (ex Dulcina madagascariensis)]|nr:fibronectin type III domain-containing protein [Candidatus Thiodiazotropha sp. (ex Dulcina madagascariensis)]